MREPPRIVPAPPKILRGSWSLTVDVEEWFHNCWHVEYVQPALRPTVPYELERLLPELLQELERHGLPATFFVLEEVALRYPQLVQEIARCGHEVASHGDLHLRVGSRSRRDWRSALVAAKSRLEDLLGRKVLGYRAPEWSLRTWRNPRFLDLGEIGFEYDSSLLPAWGAGTRENPKAVCRMDLGSGGSLWEFPPMVLPGRFPGGGWTGRLCSNRLWQAVFSRNRDAGLVPVVVVHPWELTDRPLPGLLTGFARFFHEVGRLGFRDRFWQRMVPEGARTLAALVQDLETQLSAPEEVAFSGSKRVQNPLSLMAFKP